MCALKTRFLAVLALSTALEGFALAQLPQVGAKLLGVDFIKTPERQLYGFALEELSDKRVSVAVDRQWLQATYPDFYQQIADVEQMEFEDVKRIKLSRIRQWMTDRSDAKYAKLQHFLQSEVGFIEQFQRQGTPSTFVLLEIPANKLNQIRFAKPQLRHIAGVAYQHHLANITVSSTVALEKQLQEKGVDASKETFDLTNQLPPMTKESDRQWAARQALVEYDLDHFDLQGIGGMLVDSSDSLDLPNLLRSIMSGSEGLLGSGGQLLSGNSGASLDLLDSETLDQLAKELRLDSPGLLDSRGDTAPGSPATTPRWQKTAIEKAQLRNSRGVFILQLDQDPMQSSVRIHATFLAREEPNQWFTVFSGTFANDGQTATQEELKRLQEAPNVKSILPLAEALGGQELLDKALRQGAATAAAINDARRQFNQFRTPYVRNLMSVSVKLPPQTVPNKN